MNPIIQRELVGLLRTKRALLAQVALTAILGLLVVLRWPESGRVNLSGEQAQAVLRLFGYGLLASLVLLAPVFPASAMVREKQQRTLELLLNSPLTPWAIFLGKLVASLGFIVLLLLLSIPAAAACFAMGGVDTRDILHLYGILFLVALEYSVVALYVSTMAASAESALRYTYGAVLLLTLIPLIPQKFVQGQVSVILAQITDTFACISPLPAMMHVMRDQSIGSQGLMGPEHVELRYCLSALVVIAIFIPMTLYKLNYKLFDRNRSSGKVTDERSGMVKTYRRIMYLWFFDPQRRTKLIGPFANPVMVKDFRTQKFGRAHWMMRFFVMIVILSLGLVLACSRVALNWPVETIEGIIVILQIAVVVLVSPALAAGAISSERESGGWTLLKMTPLSAFTIVTGKLISSGRTLFLLLIATLPAYVVVVVMKVPDNEGVAKIWQALSNLVRIPIMVVLTSLLGLVMSAAISSLFKRTTAATAVSYAFMVGLCGGTLLFWMGDGAPFSRATVQTVLRVNPLATALSLIKALSFERYDLYPSNVYVMSAGIVLAATVLWVQTWRLSRPQ